MLSKLPSTAAAAAAAAVADVLPSLSPPTEVIAAVFQVKSELIPEIITPIKSKQRMKGDIIGFSDVDDGDSMISDDIDISDIKPKVKFLPSKDYVSSFTHCGQNSHGNKNRNEIVFVLDELLRHDPRWLHQI